MLRVSSLIFHFLLVEHLVKLDLARALKLFTERAYLLVLVSWLGMTGHHFEKGRVSGCIRYLEHQARFVDCLVKI